MIRSMTGFGSARLEEGPRRVSVEVRSVNHRGFKLSTRLPDEMLGLETRIERVVRERVHRGAVHMAVQVEDLSDDSAYRIDERAAAAYCRQIEALQDKLGLRGEIRMETLVLLPGVAQKENGAGALDEAAWELVEQAAREALDKLIRMREEEGRFLWDEMVERSRLVERMVAEVESRAPQAIEDYRERLSQRLDGLLAKVGQEVRPEDVHREIAIYVDRADITEEFERLRSHLAQLRATNDADEPVGRKLDFIVQEMFREGNTMGSKSHDPEMTRRILDIKAELEKLREQASNVE